MSILIVHARWNELSSQQEVLLQGLLEQQRSAEGCCSSTSRQEGSSLLTTTVWEDERSMLAFDRGPMARLRTDLGEPQTAVFAVSELFAPAYRRTPVTVPAPRTTEAPAVLAG